MQLSPAEIRAIRRGQHAHRRLLFLGIGFLALGMASFFLKLAGVVGALHIEWHALLICVGVAVTLAIIWIDTTPSDVLQRHLNQDPEALKQLAYSAEEPLAARQ